VGSENLLLVAGDGDRPNAIGDSLMMLGYSIFLSTDAAETIQQASNDEFPLVIVDASASASIDPGRFAEALKRSRPGSALLIIGTAELEYLAHHEHVAFLEKPVSLMDLATGVRRLLDKRAPVPLD
jgi:DNA-binding NtrC family response regulator